MKIFYLMLSLFAFIRTKYTDKNKNLFSRSLVNYDYCSFSCGGHGECYQVGKEVGTRYYRCLCDDGYCDERDESGHIYETVYHPFFYKCTKKCVDVLKSDIKDIIGVDPDLIDSSNANSFFDFKAKNQGLMSFINYINN